MSQHRRLTTDQDFTEAIQRQTKLRVFRDDHMVESNAIVVRFSDQSVVLQSGVSEITYFDRAQCEFYSLRSR